MLKFLDEYRDSALSTEIAEKIISISTKPINIMEVCGGHTMAIRKNGIHKLVGEKINLISGPGCPVCVSAISDVDRAIALSRIDSVCVCTFGDLFYVPGTDSSLAKEKANGADIRIVYSVKDVIEFARAERDKKFIFISIGFETTVPTAAAAVVEAYEKGINNFYILSLNKTLPNALKVLLRSPYSTIDALICPGHVSTITGIDMYRFIVNKLKIPCCVTGFEPTDILTSIYILTKLYQDATPELVNGYKRAVRDKGNEVAQAVIKEVFKPIDATWRGIGTIQESGLGLKNRYKRFDAMENFDVKIPKPYENPNCICGDILTGHKKPTDCALFKKACTPTDPKGACMVSSEGSCAAVFKYGE